MRLRKVVLDTNLYVDWLNTGGREDLFTGPGLIRYLPAVVHMELRAGAKLAKARRALDKLVRAYRSVARVIVLDDPAFELAGATLRALRERGREVRRSSLVNDVLIALSARSVGATLITADTDHAEIGSLVDVRVEVVAPR